MEKYYSNNKTGRMVEIMINRASGMCDKTIGMTIVIYKYKDGEETFFMENNEFYEKYSIKQDDNIEPIK